MPQLRSRATLLTQCAAVAAIVAAVAGCMFEPGNETSLASRRQLVEFRGVAILPRATVQIEAAAAPNGPFAVIATVQASGIPTVISGATLYEFSTSVAVPNVRWTQTCAGSETFVRARGGSLILTTYDSAAIAGETAEECIDDANTPFVFAASTCASEYGAPARLTAPDAPLSSPAIARDLRIVNPYQADDYACLTSIDGDLRIVDPSNTDLAFPDLASVSGDLEVRYPRALGDTASRLVELPELAAVGGDVDLESLRPAGPNPGGPMTIELGMPTLAEIGGALTISFEGVGSGFDSVRGLSALIAHAGDATIQNLRPLDTGYASLLPELASIGGDATFLLGLTTTGALQELESVGGDFTLTVGTLAAPALDLAALASIGGDAFVQIGVGAGGELPALAGVNGSLALRYGTDPAQPVLPNLATVGAELRVFESQSMPGAAPLLVASLDLDANPGLVDIATLLSHVSVAPAGAISITDNPNVTDCEAQAWVDGLPGHVGPVTISGNDSC